MDLLPKPNIGEACNGCGRCCMIRVCMNGSFVQGLVRKLGDTVPGPCPALVNKKDGSYGCGIVLDPKRFIKNSNNTDEVLSRNFAILIGAGKGCDELNDNDPKTEEYKLDAMIDEFLNSPARLMEAKEAMKVIHGLED